VARDREILERQLAANAGLAAQLRAAGAAPLSAEQLEALQALGYVR
jgi:hypothetical protein